MSTAAPWVEVKASVTGPQVAADVGLNPARERHKFGCVSCDSSDAFRVYANGAKCYACGWSGSVVDLAAVAWGMSPADACHRLAALHGIRAAPIHRAGPPHIERARVNALTIVNGDDVETIRRRAEVYGDLVSRLELGSGGRAYLCHRELDPDLAHWHGVRSIDSEDEWDRLRGELWDAHGLDALTSAGLADEDGQPWLPWYGREPAIMFPYLSRAGQVEAVRFRRTTPGEKRRYMAPLGAGARIPWRAEAVDGPRPLHLVIAEGELDALALVQAGYNALALGGATPSKAVLVWIVEALKDVGRLALWTDADDAGDGAVSRLTSMLVERYGSTWVRDRVTRWRATADPADTLRGAA